MIYQNIRDYRDHYYVWKKEISLVKKILLSLFMAAVIGMFAQVRIPLPFTPVPITGQTFAVLLTGIILGRKWSGISLSFYVGLGVLGLPWFAEMKSGLAILMGPTGGYLIGFILAASFVGFVSEKILNVKNIWSLLSVMILATAIIFAIGLTQLGMWLSFVKGSEVSLNELFVMGLYPFLPGAVIKIVFAATGAQLLLPRKG